jgi:hypothetical protein
MDLGFTAASDSPLVHRFERVLHALHPKCQERDSTLASDAIDSQALLSEAGHTKSLLTILKGVNQVLSGKRGKTRCYDIFTLYVTTHGGL